MPLVPSFQFTGSSSEDERQQPLFHSISNPFGTADLARDQVIAYFVDFNSDAERHRLESGLASIPDALDSLPPWYLTGTGSFLVDQLFQFLHCDSYAKHFGSESLLLAPARIEFRGIH